MNGKSTAALQSKRLRLAFLLLLPLAINLALYLAVVRPLQAKVVGLRQARMLSSLKPALESALTDAGRLLAPWRSTGFSASDPSVVMQTLQQLATTHGVRITALNSAAEIPGAATSLPLDLEVSGHFGRLAHWLGDLETRSGFRVDSWAFASVQGDSQRLTVKLTALLRGAS